MFILKFIRPFRICWHRVHFHWLRRTFGFVWLVCCGLMFHIAIFQLNIDRKIVQFPYLDLLPGTQHHGKVGVFRVQSLPRLGPRDVQRRLLLHCHQRAHTWSGHARDLYVSATSACGARLVSSSDLNRNLNFGAISFQEYVSKEITHSALYGDLIYKQKAQRTTYRAPENNVPPFLRPGQPFLFTDRPE